jgi:2-polyprenyl-3-methyl-5-hydroxy-6-metoxy-1,4-benzoquinol methylase
MNSPTGKPTVTVEAAVKQCYSTWGTGYYAEYYGPDAPYAPVHLDLVRRIVGGLDCKRLLDAGCGPASILRHLVASGRSLYGFDLTPEMVSEARRVMRELGTPSEHIWEGSVLNSTDFTPPGESHADFECTVCCGVLPHIPSSADTECISNIRASLRPGGHAIVEARNQLFSLFTMNRPSYEFIMGELIRADELVERAGDVREKLVASLESLKEHFRMDLPPVRRGKAGEPGYDEVLSRTHNPLTLRSQFEAAGFRDVQVLFYHFHPLPPMLASRMPDLFRRESLAMEEPGDWRGYFIASAFLLVGERA